MRADALLDRIYDADPRRGIRLFGGAHSRVRRRTDSPGEADYRRPMNLTLSLAPIISLIAGILILVVPRLLNYIVAVYLIVIGVIGLLGAGNFRFS
jgi:hypothetical protein